MLAFGLAVTLDRTRVIQKHSLTGFIHPKARVAALLGGPGRNIARHQVSECRVPTLEVIIPVSLRQFQRPATFLSESPQRLPSFAGTQIRPSFRRDSDISVSFDWCSPETGNAGRVNLREARVRHERSLSCAPSRKLKRSSPSRSCSKRTRCHTHRKPARQRAQRAAPARP